MTETGTLEVAERADVIVRELRESDLPLADVILRSAFDTFTGGVLHQVRVGQTGARRRAALRGAPRRLRSAGCRPPGGSR